MAWIAPNVERSDGYPAHRNNPELEILRDCLDWHPATLLRKCAGLDAGARVGPGAEDVATGGLAGNDARR